MNDALRAEIEALRRQKTKTLRARYRELFGEESRSANHAHLFRRVAWRLQALAEGDLSERARIRAAELASDVDLRLRPPRSFWKEMESQPAVAPTRDRRVPPVGRRIERKFRGEVITVTVAENGFDYNGRRYRSLSSIAREVSGSNWNGYEFFGLHNEPEDA